jgi:hypothetical protein
MLDIVGLLTNEWCRKGSGYNFPLPRRRKPANLYLNFRLISKFLTSPHFKPVIEAREHEGMKHRFPGLRSYNEKVTYILPTTPESDFPCPVPSNIICCGPIILPSAPLSTVDPDLETWLKARPTVLLSLGSFLRTSLEHAQELALGIRIFLDENSTHQVIWKLKTEGTIHESILQAATKILSEHVESTRVRIVQWLKAAPSEIVQSGYVVCSVHHGGSSSYFEALRYHLISFLLIIPPIKQLTSFSTSFSTPLSTFKTNSHSTALVFPKSCFPAGGTHTNLPSASNTWVSASMEVANQKAHLKRTALNLARHC